MRRADRLFQIIQILRRGRVITAEALGEELQVSKRTVYRDVRDLMNSGVPILSEAGVGYQLARGFELPPLMFDAEEIQALVLGARMVATWGDEALSRSARRALEKVEQVLPAARRQGLQETALFSLSFRQLEPTKKRVGMLRQAVDQRQKLKVSYVDGKGNPTDRILYPLGLYFWGASWSLGAWCTLREGFRSFRLDRFQDITLLGESFPEGEPYTVQCFLAYVQQEDGPQPTSPSMP